MKSIKKTFFNYRKKKNRKPKKIDFDDMLFYSNGHVFGVDI